MFFLFFYQPQLFPSPRATNMCPVCWIAPHGVGEAKEARYDGVSVVEGDFSVGKWKSRTTTQEDKSDLHYEILSFADYISLTPAEVSLLLFAVFFSNWIGLD